MRVETKKRYLKRFSTHMKGLKINKKSIVERLVELAFDQTGNSWRETRNAFATAIEHNAKKWSHGNKKRFEDIIKLSKDIRSLKNPIDIKDRKKPIKKRIKKVSNDDINKMLEASVLIDEKSGKISRCVINIISKTGIRPDEFFLLKKHDDYSISVVSSKKTKNRGLDRIIEFTSKYEAEFVIKEINELNKLLLRYKDPKRKIRDSFYLCAKKAFPRRKLLPTPYSLRHQFGSNLKSSNLSRYEIAYLMGHQATASVERYGNVKSGSSSNVKVKPGLSIDEIKEVVRKTHTDFVKNEKDKLLTLKNNHDNEITRTM